MTVPHVKLAALCDKVYSTPDQHLATVHEVDCLFEQHGDYLVLAFRGTQASASWPLKWSWEGVSNLRDIIRDLRFLPWKDPVARVWVHKGFGLSARWWVRQFARTLPKDVPLVLTGHSLGAGVAPLVARLLAMQGFNVAEVVLFGEPKGHYWKSRESYTRLGISTTSYRNRNDWIRYAGVGRLTVDPTVLNPGEYSAADSHDIRVYHQALSPQP